MAESDRRELDRRAFLRRAAVTGLVTAWAAPTVQSIAATPAFAQVNGGTPAPGDCFHSEGGETGEGCIGACTAAGCTGEACDGVDPDPCNPFYGGDGPCSYLCPPGEGGQNPCCNPGLCDPDNFQCQTVPNCQDQGPEMVQIAVYTGSLVGCPPVPPPP
jgi:hypothetical protein